MPLDFPNTPSNGSTYTADGVTWQYDGEKWIIIGSGTDPVAVSASPPTSPGPGDAWFDTDSGTLLVYYDGFWVAPSVNYSIGTAAVGTAQIADGAVTTAKLANGPTFVSTLPSSPVDGQEIYYQASGDMATNGIVWHLRYRSGSSSSYKWEYIGGASLTTRSQAQSAGDSPQTNTWTNLNDAIEITVPLAGDYFVNGKCSFFRASDGLNTMELGISRDSTAGAISNYVYGGAYWHFCATSGLLTGIGANKKFALRFRTPAAGGYYRMGAGLEVRPVRVG